MKFAFRAWIMLFAATLGLGAASALAGQPGPLLIASQGRLRGEATSMHNASLLSDAESAPSTEPIEPQPEWDGADAGVDCDEGCDVGCFSGGCLQRGKWYGSIDYLLFRPRFSQAVTSVRRTLVTETSSELGSSTLVDQAIEAGFDYQSGFRAALGYRLLDCGGDIQVSQLRMNATGNATDGPANTVSNNPFIAGQLKNNPGNGGTLTTNYGVTANIFDVDFAKCLSFGGPCEPCDPCFCPRWDLRFWAGARIADISRYDNNVATTPPLTPSESQTVTTGDINARFVGAGPRIGGQGRRYSAGTAASHCTPAAARPC